MSDDKEFWSKANQVFREAEERSRIGDVDGNSGSETVSGIGSDDGSVDVDEERGTEGEVVEIQYGDAVDVRSGFTASGRFNRAVAEYDENDLSPQEAEHFTFSDPDFARRGRL